MKELQGPFPGVAWRERLAANIQPPLMDFYSGELKASVWKRPLGAARVSGKVASVWMSVEQSGKDDTNPLMFSGEVFINGVTCLSTRPCINHVSGETSQQKTTKQTGDTGITQAVIDSAANSVSVGDVLTYDFKITRTATPTTEIRHPVIVVEIEPDI